DSVPHDAYTLKDGQIFPVHVTVRASEPRLDLRAPRSSVRLAIDFETDTRPSNGDGIESAVQEILRGYQQHRRDTTLLIPTGAMACVRYFKELAAANHSLFLAADFGDTHLTDVWDGDKLGLGASGGFWLPVNFHALGEYARSIGGHVRH